MSRFELEKLDAQLQKVDSEISIIEKVVSDFKDTGLLDQSPSLPRPVILDNYVPILTHLRIIRANTLYEKLTLEYDIDISRYQTH